MVGLDVLDLSHYFVRHGINEVDVVPGAVGLDDPELGARAGLRPTHPCREGLPLRGILRVPVFAASVECVAARLGGQQVDEQPALQAAGNHPLPDDIEILAGLLLIPGAASRRKGLQAHGGACYVASDAAGVTRALRQENRLYLRFEKVEVQLRRLVLRRMRLLDCEPDRHQDTGAYCQKQYSSPVETLCQIHVTSTVKNRCC